MLSVAGKKTQRFELTGDVIPQWAQFLPTARYYEARRTVHLVACIEAWNALEPLVEAGLVYPNGRASQELEAIRQMYIAGRISQRRAALKFKSQENTAVELPMRSRAWDHQARAIGFAYGIPNSAVLMEQGTGKTFVGIGVAGKRYLDGSIKRLLVLTTKSSVSVWKNQFSEHAGYEHDCEAHEEKIVFPDPSNPGLSVLVIGYDRMQRNRKSVAAWKPDMIILDESQKIQRNRSKRTAAVRLAAKSSKFRMIETGTPLGQNPITAYSQYSFLEPDLFGRSYAAFKERYCELGGYMGMEIQGFKNLDEFAEKIHSISFRCTKAECLDLPKEVHQRIYVTMDAACRRVYRDLDLNFVTMLGDEQISVDRRISAISKLRQLTGGMVKNDRGELIPVSRAKINALMESVEDRDWSHKLVIFTVFDHEMEMCLDMLRVIGRESLSLCGSTRGREQVCKLFQTDPTYDAIVVQTATGGAGIELYAATEAVFFSPTFSFLDDSQARARIHRIGQVHPVTYGRLIMKDSVDEDVVKVLESSGTQSIDILDGRRNYKLKRSKLR